MEIRNFSLSIENFIPYVRDNLSILNSEFCNEAVERFSVYGKRQAEISCLPKTREIYLVSAYILPVSHSYGASTKTEK